MPVCTTSKQLMDAENLMAGLNNCSFVKFSDGVDKVDHYICYTVSDSRTVYKDSSFIFVMPASGMGLVFCLSVRPSVHTSVRQHLQSPQCQPYCSGLLL